IVLILYIVKESKNMEKHRISFVASLVAVALAAALGTAQAETPKAPATPNNRGIPLPSLQHQIENSAKRSHIWTPGTVVTFEYSADHTIASAALFKNAASGGSSMTPRLPNATATFKVIQLMEDQAASPIKYRGRVWQPTLRLDKPAPPMKRATKIF